MGGKIVLFYQYAILGDIFLPDLTSGGVFNLSFFPSGIILLTLQRSAAGNLYPSLIVSPFIFPPVCIHLFRVPELMS